MVNWTRAKVARYFKRQSLLNALVITVSGAREKAAIWRLDECGMGGQRILLQAIPAQTRSWSERKCSKSAKMSPTTAGCREVTAASTRWAQGLTGMPTMMPTRTNRLGPPPVPLWPPTCTREATMEAGSFFIRVGRTGRRRRPAELAIRHGPLKSPPELTLRAALSATGGAPSSNRITGNAQSTKPTRRRTRMRTGSRSVHRPTYRKPRWKCPRTSSQS